MNTAIPQRETQTTMAQTKPAPSRTAIANLSQVQWLSTSDGPFKVLSTETLEAELPSRSGGLGLLSTVIPASFFDAVAACARSYGVFKSFGVVSLSLARSSPRVS